MEEDSGSKKNAIKFITLGVVIILLAVLLYWYFSRDRVDTGVLTTEETVDIFSQTPAVQVETNPVKKVPDLNPIENTNPFNTVNPFE